jgi:amino acid transporter
VEGNAPSLFARTSDRGVPLYALGVCSSFALIAFISVDIGSFETFRYFVSLVTIFGLLTWISILLSHIYFVRARRAQHVPDTALAYISPFGIHGSFCALIFAFIILIFNGFADFVPNPVTGERFQWRKFIVNYIGVIIFGVMIAGYKFVVKTKVWSAKQADIFEGKQRIDDDEAEFLAAEVIRLRDCPESKWTKWYRITLGNFF